MQYNIGLFVTCLVDLYRPSVAFSSIKLLESAGCTVGVPPSQTCCGQPAFNSGDNKTSQAIAKSTIEAFEVFDFVVAPSGSCAGMLKAHYPALFDEGTDWHKKAVALASRVYELTSFLVDVLQLPHEKTQFDKTVTYHDSCAGLRELGIKDQPRKLLANSTNCTITEMEDTDVCCGFGGTFCVKYPEISSRMVTDKAALATQTGAQVLLGGDMGCLMNIAGRLSRAGSAVEVRHIAEVLADDLTTPAIGKA
ncbi:MAG: (Fe-S)-binding protein [Granulosicoccaceae bacterium]